VVNRLLDRAVFQRDEFAQGHQLAAGAAHRQLQQILQVALGGYWQLQACGRRVFTFVVQMGDVLAREPGAQRSDQLLLRDAECGGLAAIDNQ
jgi:hypothetical protein